MSPTAWLSELNRILLVFVPCILLGMATGKLPLFFILGLIVYGLWTARQLVTLRAWLDAGAMPSEAPEYLGIADQHVTSIVDLQKNTQAKQNSLEQVVSQFNQMIAALPDAVVVMATSGEILSSNHAAKGLLEIDEATDLHTRITQLIRKPDFTDFFFAGKFNSPLEIRGTTANEPELSIRIFPFGDERIVLIAQDLSQSARIYEMRRSFISNASHELRTPLTVILGYLESLSENRDLNDGCMNAVKSAEAQAQRMKQLVEDLLTLSRLESTAAIAKNTKVISVTSIIAEVVNDSKLSNWFTSHEINSSIETDAKLRGNLQEIHSVISNLVNNAVKHTEAGTVITITWKLAEDDALQLIVEDNGQGIASEHINRLTERFYRVDAGRSREKGGTGLGLSIVKHIIERHEGELNIDSTSGSGTVFSCTFPAKRVVLNGKHS